MSLYVLKDQNKTIASTSISLETYISNLLEIESFNKDVELRKFSEYYDESVKNFLDFVERMTQANPKIIMYLEYPTEEMCPIVSIVKNNRCFVFVFRNIDSCIKSKVSLYEKPTRTYGNYFDVRDIKIEDVLLNIKELVYFMDYF